jgi:hypothetical protein
MARLHDIFGTGQIPYLQEMAGIFSDFRQNSLGEIV